MVEALGYRLHQIVICSAQYGRRRYRRYEIGIAQVSHVGEMDPGIKYLSAMAAELSGIPAVMMLVYLSVVTL